MYCTRRGGTHMLVELCAEVSVVDHLGQKHCMRIVLW